MTTITIHEAADFLGVSTKTLRRWDTSGALVPDRTEGNQRRYLMTDLEAFQKHGGKHHYSENHEITERGEKTEKYERSMASVILNPSPSTDGSRVKDLFQTGILRSAQNDRNMQSSPGAHESHVHLRSFFSFLNKPQKYVIGFMAFLLITSSSASLGSYIGRLRRQNSQSFVLGESSMNASPLSLFDGLPAGSVLAAASDSNQYLMRINIPTNLALGVTVDGDSVFNGNSEFNGDVNITGTLTASNLSTFLSGITAGTGISVGTGVKPTITNTGVTSFGGATGAVTLTAGTGITISGTTISAQTAAAAAVTNSFATINVDGTAITAGTATDILKLVSGSGIALTASGKTITFTIDSPITVADGGTGLATYTIGDMLYASAADTLSTIPLGTGGQALIIQGGVPVWKDISGDVCTNCIVEDPAVSQTIIPTADVTGFALRGANGGTSNIFTISDYAGTATYFTVDASGNLTLGNSTSNTVAFISRVNSIIEPSMGSQYDLGSSTRRWKTVFGDEANFTNFTTEHASISGTTSEDFLINSDYLGNDGESSSLTFERGSPAVNASLLWNTTDSSIPFHIFELNAPVFVNPDTGITPSGTAAFIVNQPFAEDILTASASGVTKFVIKNNGNVGIGTTNPQYPLDVNGTINATTLAIGGTAITSTATELNMLDGTTVAAGGALFGDGTKIAQDVSNFFWDDTNNRLGIGTSAPAVNLHVLGTTEQFRLGYDASNYSSFTVDSAGILTLADTGTNIAAFGEANAEFYVPTTFSASGDVSIAYDLIFTNQTIGNIKSYGPLAIESGESFENNNLTLKTYGTGDLVADIGGNLVMQSADPALVFDSLTATDTDYYAGVLEDAGGDDDDLFMIGEGTTVGTTPYLTINTSGYVGLGTTAPTNLLDVAGGVKIGAGYAGIATTAPTNGLLVQGNVGIGTTIVSTNYLLDVRGDIIQSGSGTHSNIYMDSDASAIFTIDRGASNRQAFIRYYSAGIGKYGVGMNSNSDNFYIGNSNLSSAYLTVDPNGYVGIGTTAPTDKLDVAGGVKIGAGYAGIATSAPANGLLVQGNVGIGTTNPTTKLYVDGTIYGTGVIQSMKALSDTPGSLGFTGNNSYWGMRTGTNGRFALDTYNLSSAFQESLTVLRGGNVGIGTTNPSVPLEISDSVAGIRSAGSLQLRNPQAQGYDMGTALSFALQSGQPKASISFRNNNLSNGRGELRFIIDSADDANVATYTDTKMIIDYAGNVGIGTTGPTNILDVAGGVKIGSSYAGMSTTAPANGLLVEGNVGIGTTQPGYKFQVVIDDSNEGHVTSTGAWANTSDARLKTNILTLNSSLGTVMGLRPVTYNSLNDPTGEKSGLHIGFIAQEVEKLIPQMVDTDPVTGYKSVSYGLLIPFLTSAIQEQQGQIATLAGKLADTATSEVIPTPTLSAPYSLSLSTAEYNIATLTGLLSEGVSGATLSGFLSGQTLIGSRSDLQGVQDFIGRSISTWLTDLVVDGYTLFKKSVIFAQTVLFQSPVQVASNFFVTGHIMVGKDTAGVAIISQYTDAVAVKFETPYDVAPLIHITLVTKTATESGSFLDEGHSAVVTDITKNGFSISLPEQALRDYEYHWVAVAVKDVNVTKSTTQMSEVMGAGYQSAPGLASPSATTVPLSGTPTISPSATPTPTILPNPDVPVATESAIP